MSASRFFGLGLVAVFGLVACGGSIASTIDGTSPPGTSPDAGSNDDGGGPSANDDGGQPSACGNPNRLDLPVSQMCIASEIQFDDPFTLTMALDETGISCATCTANISDGTIRLEVDGTTCPQGQVCDNANATIQCTIPALISGTYTVFFTHGDNLDQFTINASSGGPTSCALAPAQPLDPTKYSEACQSDFDCTLVPAGDPCQSCNCNAQPIAQSAQAQYQNDYAIQAAECPEPANAPPIGCGCPAGGEPKCIKNTCQAVSLANGD